MCPDIFLMRDALLQEFDSDNGTQSILLNRHRLHNLLQRRITKTMPIGVKLNNQLYLSLHLFQRRIR